MSAMSYIRPATTSCSAKIRRTSSADRVATHSPMLLTLPGAKILSLDGGYIHSVSSYQDTEHFRITRDFLNAPERFYRYLLEDEE